MSKAPTPNYDVFLSHTGADAATAEDVKQQFRANGLSVFSVADIEPGADTYEAVRRGVRDSLTFVALVTPASARSAFLAFEYGAAWGWATPVYVLTRDIATGELPSYLTREPVFPFPAGLPQVIAMIREQSQPLNEDEKRTLGRVYAQIGVSADRLLTEPEDADRLATLFAAETARRVPTFRLIRELHRLRKAGKLPRSARHVAK